MQEAAGGKAPTPRSRSTKRLLQLRKSTPLFRLLFFVFVNRNRIQIFGFKDLTAIEAADIIDAIAPVKELGSLVLTTLHSEITPILD
jgi:hypothetical protein